VEKKLKCVTGEINVKFKKPTLTDKTYHARGKVIEVRKRLVFSEGSLMDGSGEIMATARGKLFTVE